MIIDEAFKLFAEAFQGIADKAPSVTFDPHGWASVIAAVLHELWAFNTVLPVDAYFIALTVGLLLLNTSLINQTAMWVVRKLPFVSIR